MSDHLSVAASIAGLITIADIVVRKGYRYLHDLKAVEKDAKKLIDEVNLLSGILHSLKNVAEYLESDDYEFDPATQIHYVNACQKSLLRIQKRLDGADPTLTSGAKKLKNKLKWPFEKHKTEELLAEIEKHKATMTLAMSADQMSALLDLLRRGEVLQKKVDSIHSSVLEMQGVQHRLIGDETKKKMLQYLSKLDIENWQRSNLALRQPGTGIWFTDGEEFKAWTSTENSKLWIYGIPGAGKTILVSSIIQELSNFVGNRRALAFFYCDYKDPQTHDPVTIFGALAKQLAVQNELCLQELERFYTARIGLDGLERRANPDELCELIRSLAIHFEEAMIVVDGLDEISKGRSDVTRLLAVLCCCVSIKVILSSRPEIDIRRHLSSFTPISIAACSADLQLYVASEIEKRISNGSLTISDPILKEEIMRTLVERADGMFRWVSCQMDYLCECSTDRERYNALRKLPPDLPSSYRRILDRVNASTKYNQQLVTYTLQWIVFGIQKLTIPALLEALGCIDNETTFDRACCTTADQLQHWCSSLVRMSSEGVLEIAHFTVKEYLTSIDPMQEPQLAKFKASEDLANANLATTCLTYLNYPAFKTLPFPKIVDENGEYLIRKYLDTYHFLTYATVFWDEHARAIMDNPSIFKKVQMLFRSDRKTFKFWKRLRFSLIRRYDNGTMLRDSDGYKTAQGTTPLHWAAILALPLVCEWLLQNQPDLNIPSYLGSPLLCALLQDTEVDMDYKYSTDYEDKPIWRESDRKTVIRMLVKRGSVIDIVSPYCEITPLAVSFRWTLLGVTQLLMDLGAKLTFDDLQEVIEIQADEVWSWQGLPATAHKLAKFIIPDEEHGLEETIFRLGVILTIPWVKNKESGICDESENAETSYDATIVPKCLDIGYNGPISESTLQLLRFTIEIQAGLGSPDTLLALVEYLRKVDTSPQALASPLFRAVDRYVNSFVAGNYLKISAILTTLDILEGLGNFLWSDNRGEALMHGALSWHLLLKPRQIMDKLMKYVVDPGYVNDNGENLIHLAARIRNSSILQTFFETYDCTLALGKITKSGLCALTYAVRYKLDSNVEVLVKEYAAADERTIRLIVHNALQRKEDGVLEVMRKSKVFSDYLRAEQSEQESPIQESIDCMGAINVCQTTLPCRITGESLLNVAENSRTGANEDVFMEDVA